MAQNTSLFNNTQNYLGYAISPVRVPLQKLTLDFHYTDCQGMKELSKVNTTLHILTSQISQSHNAL
ncbi:unnamed protein product [Paramecium octaurelia]|uniref:Uncharacterized protein n=1 Tax=Paramecium octaurelia TaxID=43137 RepID=A0A8S1YMR7_PAROT|nr:unnamed protein product [Paramecium octaurelia]